MTDRPTRDRPSEDRARRLRYWERRKGTKEYLAHQLTQSTSRVAGSELLVNLGSGRMGTLMFGVEGGRERSIHNVMAVPVAMDLATALNVSPDKALDLLRVVGVVMHRRLLEGHPCGIPFVAVIGTHQYRLTAEQLAMEKARLHDRIDYYTQKKAEGWPGSSKRTVDQLIQAKWNRLDKIAEVKRIMVLEMTPGLRDLFRRNANYHGDIRDIARVEWEEQQHHRNGYRSRGVIPPDMNHNVEMLTGPVKAARRAAGILPSRPISNVKPENRHARNLKAQIRASRQARAAH